MKVLSDGRSMVNLGCGTRMHWSWNNVDFSHLGKLRRRMGFAHLLYKRGLLSEDRWRRLQSIDPHIIIHDLSKGIPFPDNSVDVIYHSHVLEHINREIAPVFLQECRRVLKNGGTIRIVIPDLEVLIMNYNRALSALDEGREEALAEHREAIDEIFEQMVRSEGVGTKLQRPLVKAIERTFRGDASKAGEVHRWMYDRYSLSYLLTQVGFHSVQTQQATTSSIEGWNSFHLDTESDGKAYKSHSLYMEATK